MDKKIMTVPTSHVELIQTTGGITVMMHSPEAPAYGFTITKEQISDLIERLSKIREEVA